MKITRFLCNKVGELTKLYSNMPEKYIERETVPVYYRTPKGIQFQKKEIKRKHIHFSTFRPWERGFKMENAPHVHNPKVFVEPIPKWSFFKGDRVEILVGKDKGKQGVVKHVYQERNFVIVDGLNCELRKMEASKKFPGIYYKHELPLKVTNEVKLIDPSDLAATDIEWRYTEKGELVRVSTRTLRTIPIPESSKETYDYKSKAQYVASRKDTEPKVVSSRTFQPKHMTFEMEIMQENGIQEDRVPAKTYWY